MEQVHGESLSAFATRRHLFAVEGLSCATCVRAVETELKKIKGVSFASVNLATEKVFVLTEVDVPEHELFQGVVRAGYKAKPLGSDQHDESKRFQRAHRQFLLAWVFTIPVILLMGLHLSHRVHGNWPVVAEGLLALLMAVFPGRSTFRSALIAVTHRHANMDVLVTLAFLAAVCSVPLSLVLSDLMSFGGIGVMILAFHLSGRFIEARLKWKASQDLRRLLERQNTDCQILLADGTVERFPAKELKEGMRIVLRSGEQVGADGLLEEGQVWVDMSMVSGEALPVLCQAGQQLVGGTVITQGSGVLLVQNVGEKSFLNKMLSLVEQAQSIRVPLQALADRITHYFVPVVFVLATIAGVFWGLTQNVSLGLSVWIASLVIACPCAIGLATPMALLVATAQASRLGILFKTGEALQLTHRLSVLVFDKTGTLTEGSPRVVAHTIPQEFWPLVAALESKSLHPLSRALLEAAKLHEFSEIPQVEEVVETPGIGIRARWNSGEVFIGQPREPERYHEWLNQGRTVVELRRGETVLGGIALEDSLKDDAVQTIKDLRQRGIEVVLATGDNTTTARRVANQVGIEKVYSQVKPDQKFELVVQLQQQGHQVGMVGDGINDAAALKAAQVGIAMGSASALSAESSDVVLLHNQLERILDLIRMSKLTYNQIKFNLFWAFAYNLVALPLALLGWIHPLMAEAAMVGSSLTVILGSFVLAAKMRKRKKEE